MNSQLRHLSLLIGIFSLPLFGFTSVTNTNTIDKFLPEMANEREKVFLHLDRSQYELGELIWFKAYIVAAGNNRPEARSEIVYVDLINPQNAILGTKVIKVKNGGGHGEFQIPINAEKGDYTLRAYSNFMRNFDESHFYRKTIRVGSLAKATNAEVYRGEKPMVDIRETHIGLDQPDLQFFPEGGNLVSGLVNRVAFKAVAPDGLGTGVEGKVVDESDKLITEFSSSHLGMGMLSFIPEMGKTYQARIEHNGKTFVYSLPNAMDKGIMLNVFDRGEHYQAEIKSSENGMVNGLVLLAFQGSEEMINAPVEGKENKAVVNLPKETIKEGIVRFTLFNEAGRPICERLIFHQVHEEDFLMEVDKDRYGNRELVELEIQVPENIWDFKGNLSLAVSNAPAMSVGINEMDIKTYLLLSSELKGRIENPTYYFHAEDDDRLKNLDLLMMTQGWRSYVEYAPKDDEPKYLYENGVTISGRVTKTNKRDEPAIAKVSLAYRNGGELGFDVVETNDNGEFEFKDLNFDNRTSVFVYADDISKKKRKATKTKSNPNLFIELDTFQAPEVNSKVGALPTLEETGSTYYPVVIPEYKPFVVDDAEIIRLKEAVVTEKKLGEDANVERKRRGALYTRPSFSLDYEQFRNAPIGNALTPLQGRIPGIQILNNTVVVRSQFWKRPLYLLDGFPVDEETIFQTPITDIDFVDYIRPERGTMYGIRGGNGIIAVYTLDGRERYYKDSPEHKNGQGTLTYVHNTGSTKKFYEPLYHLRDENAGKPDLRKTLCWKPNLIIGENGNAKVSFYTSDVSATYQAVLQGVSNAGDPVYAKLFFAAE
nr:hypothetical protein [Allomuricauda sp.]